MVDFLLVTARTFSLVVEALRVEICPRGDEPKTEAQRLHQDKLSGIFYESKPKKTKIYICTFDKHSEVVRQLFYCFYTSSSAVNDLCQTCTVRKRKKLHSIF